MADDKTIQELLEKQNNFIQVQKNYWRFSNNDMEETPNMAFLFFNLKSCISGNEKVGRAACGCAAGARRVRAMVPARI